MSVVAGQVTKAREESCHNETIIKAGGIRVFEYVAYPEIWGLLYIQRIGPLKRVK
jgi:hypothetical protein